tara:strand:- start:4991 stop:5365 length:375 start_codon:yes stop_codon:yes gene_type:complete
MNEIVPKRDIPESVHSSYDEDLDLIRSTLRGLLMSGEEGLELAQSVARESEHPRAIEVLTGMIKQQAENAHALLDMHKRNQDINVAQTKGQSDEKKSLTQNVFVGSTAELQKMLRGDVIEHESE